MIRITSTYKKIYLLSGMIMLLFIMLTSSVANASDLIEIRTADELRAIDNNLSGNYILMNDIDLSETRQGGQLD